MGLGLEENKEGIHWTKTKFHPYDETLLNFIKRKHPMKESEKETRDKDQSLASKQPKWGGPQGGKGTERSTSLMKLVN